MGGNSQSHLYPIFGPSKILWIKNATNLELTKAFETFRQIYSDFMYKCREYGDVKSIKLPRPVPSGEEEDQWTYPAGFGSVFVEYDKIEEA